MATENIPSVQDKGSYSVSHTFPLYLNKMRTIYTQDKIMWSKKTPKFSWGKLCPFVWRDNIVVHYVIILGP